MENTCFLCLFCRAHLLLLPVSAGLVYNSALFPVDWSLPANSSCREAAIEFILLFHIESNDEATPTTKQQIIVISQSDGHHWVDQEISLLSLYALFSQ